MKCERDTIGRSPINCPVPIVNLANTERARQRQTMRGAAHLGRRRHDEHVTYIAQRVLKYLQTARVDTVVIRNQNARHCWYKNSQARRRTRALVRRTGTSLLVVNNRVSSLESETRT